MSLDLVKSATREVVNRLTRGDYDWVIARSIKSRLTSDDLRNVIGAYGRKLVSPPGDVYEKLDAVQVKRAGPPAWSVRAPLWTEEEGRSDLTLELTIAVSAGTPSVELQDLHVL